MLRQHLQQRIYLQCCLRLPLPRLYRNLLPDLLARHHPVIRLFLRRDTAHKRLLLQRRLRHDCVLPGVRAWAELQLRRHDNLWHYHMVLQWCDHPLCLPEQPNHYFIAMRLRFDRGVVWLLHFRLVFVRLLPAAPVLRGRNKLPLRKCVGADLHRFRPVGMHRHILLSDGSRMRACVPVRQRAIQQLHVRLIHSVVGRLLFDLQVRPVSAQLP